jgi:hypothetical protein
MATSGTYTTTTTALSLITNAFLNIGSAALGETLPAPKSKLAREGLNYITNLWEGPPNFIQRGMKMWKRETGLLTLDSTKNSYSLTPSGGDLDIQVPVEILTTVIRNTAQSTDVPLHPITLAQYQSLTNKSATGTPRYYYYEKRISEGILYLDLIPSASVATDYKISFVYRQPLEVISANTNEFDIESSYLMALEFALSRWLAPKMGRAISQDVNMQYVEALELAQTFQPEDVYLFYEKDREI